MACLKVCLHFDGLQACPCMGLRSVQISNFLSMIVAQITALKVIHALSLNYYFLIEKINKGNLVQNQQKWPF